MSPAERAEAKIAEFGIQAPEDLDVRALAREANMRVQFGSPDGCEATLVGYGNFAIATIRRSGVVGRDRFSIAHELGHWEMHRGKSFRCRADDPDLNLVSHAPAEQEADTYASHLLMPGPIFNPAVKERGQPSFVELADLGNLFGTSLLATCLRLAAVDTLPVIVACYNEQQVRWFKSAAHVPKRWWLHKQLDEDSFAYDVIHKGKAKRTLGKQSANTWFCNSDAERYEIFEAAVSGRSGEVLVVLYLTMPMMSARFDPEVGTRKYNQFGSYVTRGR